MASKEMVDEWRDVLTPIVPEEKELTPPPKKEYKIIEATTMDKVIRDVNTHLNNGWQTEWGIQVVNGPVTKFYQSLIRWNVDTEEDLPTETKENVDNQGGEEVY